MLFCATDSVNLVQGGEGGQGGGGGGGGGGNLKSIDPRDGLLFGWAQ